MNNDEIEFFEIDDSTANTSPVTQNTQPINVNNQVNNNQTVNINNQVNNEQFVNTTPVIQNIQPINNEQSVSAVQTNPVEQKPIDPKQVRSVFEDPIKSEPKKKIELGENPLVEMVNNKSALKFVVIILIILFAAVFLMPILFKSGN